MNQRMVYQTDETREKILHTAEDFFAAQGYFSTQMKDISAEVGMSRNTLYRYYQDKYDLGLAVMQLALSKLAKAFELAVKRLQPQYTDNARELLMAVLLELRTSSKLERELRFMAEFDSYYAGSRMPKDIHARVSSIAPQDNQARHLLLTIIKQGMAEGSIRSDIKAERLLNMLIYSTKAMSQLVLLRGSALIYVTPDEINALVPDMFRVLGEGIKPTMDVVQL